MKKLELVSRFILANDLKKLIKYPVMTYNINIGIVIACFVYKPELLSQSLKSFLDYHIGFPKKNLEIIRKEFQETGWLSNNTLREVYPSTIPESFKRCCKTVLKLTLIKAIISKDFNLKRNLIFHLRSSFFILSVYTLANQLMTTRNIIRDHKPPNIFDKIIFCIIPGMGILIES